MALTAGLLAGSAVPASAAPHAALAAVSPHAASAADAYASLPPARLLDTRAGFTTVDGVAAAGGALGAGQSINLQVTGRGGVPTTNVGAVVLNVTATNASATTFVTAFPAGGTKPNASNLNVVSGQTIANLVIAKVGSGGQVTLFNNLGTTDLIADVEGFFPSGPDYSPLTPARLLDTRAGFTTIDGVAAAGGALGAGQSTNLQVTGRGGVPATGVGAVVLNVTAANATATSFVTAFPAGGTKPNASNLNVVSGQTIPNLVIAKVGAGGQITLFNNLGSTDLIADIEGWFPSGPDYSPLTPARLLDTRAGFSTVDGLAAATGVVHPGETRALQVTGRGGVPTSNVSAVVLNVTATDTTATSFVTVFPAGGTKPNASNLNFVKGQTIPNLVIAKVGPGGVVSLYNNLGNVDLIADVEGWFSTVPPVTAAVAGTAALNAIACPSPTFCEAVGVNSAHQGVMVPVTSGIPGAAVVVTGAGPLASIACQSATVCTAVGVTPPGGTNSGVLVTITSGTPAAAVADAAVQAFIGVSCPGANLCEAVGYNQPGSSGTGSIVAPIANGAAGPSNSVPGSGIVLFGISCPTINSCVAVGLQQTGATFQSVVVPVTGGVPGAAQPASGAGLLEGVACLTGGSCQAVGLGTGAAVVPVTNAGVPGTAKLAPDSAGIDLAGVACISTTVCQGVGGDQSLTGSAGLVSIVNGTPAGVQALSEATFLSGVACPTAATCEAVGYNSANLGVVTTVTL